MKATERTVDMQQVKLLIENCAMYQQKHINNHSVHARIVLHVFNAHSI